MIKTKLTEEQAQDEFLKGHQWTKKQIETFASLPVKEPLVYAKPRGRRPDVNSKKLLTLRVDPEVIEHFKNTGEGWQTRMNDALRRAAGLEEKPTSP